jgi:hypothetical protein
VVSFTPLPLYPREGAPDTDFIGGWVDPRTFEEIIVKGVILGSSLKMFSFILSSIPYVIHEY